MLRDNKKWSRFNGSRPIVYNMTNILAVKFSEASLKLENFSEYYGESYWKGYFGIDLCGELVVALVWSDGMSNSDYNNNIGYVQEKIKFYEKDRIDENIIPFTTGLDKGYRVKMVPWKNGKQIAIQPPYKKSDKRFTGW